MNYKVLVLVVLTSLHGWCSACTTFLLRNNGRFVFGRNYDWSTGTGMLYTNARGLKKQALVIDGGSKLNWVARYGSVSFNQYGKEFPNGGMNEKGLVVEVMWLSESKFSAVDDRPGLSVLQWVQYQLDNAATIDDVTAVDQKIRVVSAGAPLHFLVADATGQSATIEYLNGKQVVHRSGQLPYPVLANSTYTESIKAFNDAKNGNTSKLDNSTKRFTTACNMLQQYDQQKSTQEMVPYAFDILTKVSQGDFTKWSIVYDISNKKIHFKTNGFEQEKIIDMSKLNFSCNENSKAFNINQKTSGEINSKLLPYSSATNEHLVYQSFKESREQVNIDERLQRLVALTPGLSSCK